MVKLIYNISRSNDGEQHNDNNDNAIKYLESNKDNILDMAEKHFENLVETLTNNTAPSSSNPILSLPQSSSTYPTASNESDPYKEDLGISHVAKMILMNDRIISDVSLPIHFQCIAEA